MLFNLRRLRKSAALTMLAFFLCSFVSANSSETKQTGAKEAFVEIVAPQVKVAPEASIVITHRIYHILFKTKDVRGRVFHHLQEPFAPDVNVQEYVLTVVKGRFYALGNNRVIGISSYQSYYGYRWYDASNGRWINRDPIKEDGGLNVYNFCNGDPINFLDYLGLDIMYVYVFYDPHTKKYYIGETHQKDASSRYNSSEHKKARSFDCVTNQARLYTFDIDVDKTGISKRAASMGCEMLVYKHFQEVAEKKGGTVYSQNSERHLKNEKKYKQFIQDYGDKNGHIEPTKKQTLVYENMLYNKKARWMPEEESRAKRKAMYDRHEREERKKRERAERRERRTERSRKSSESLSTKVTKATTAVGLYGLFHYCNSMAKNQEAVAYSMIEISRKVENKERVDSLDIMELTNHITGGQLGYGDRVLWAKIEGAIRKAERNR